MESTSPLQSLLNAMGMSNGWVLSTIVFGIIALILLIVVIVLLVKSHNVNKRLIDVTDYALGLESLTQGQAAKPLEKKLAGDVVAQRMEQASNFKRVDSGTEEDNITEAIHRSIYASVTGTHSPVSPEDTVDLSGASPAETAPSEPVGAEAKSTSTGEEDDTWRPELGDRIPHI